ncbi:uncharacterized protein LOC132722494 [Ruditapes philippinarum]|uniref:uncharacterized protein LOC132722494 n=1 Tax=Ruditapes philippinarum TaxID=129788 RepID=UPI00295B5F2D|nr:uncharacterized protein LOC132722494 [Ruditapes philippinarum]
MILVKSPDDRPSASALLNTQLVKKHLAMFIEQKENLLQQKSSKDDSLSTPQHTPTTVPKLKQQKSNMEKPSSSLKRNKLKISTPMLQKSDYLQNAELTSRERSPHGQDSGLGVSAETDIIRENRLDIPKPDTDAASDYSDDFDDADEADSDIEEDIKEEIECVESDDSEDEIEDITENNDEAEYADDFEEYDSSEDLDAMVHLAKEAQDIEAVDDWFADSISDLHRQQTAMLRQQCKEALGGRGLKEVERLVSDGTLTEEDLSPQFALRRSIGEDSAEICHLNIDDLELG